MLRSLLYFTSTLRCDLRASISSCADSHHVHFHLKRLSGLITLTFIYYVHS